MTDSAGDSLTLSSPVEPTNTSSLPEKRFDEWNALKKIIDSAHKCKLFREREIWWYFAGENIGHEVSGKGPKFLRPILIVRKYGSQSFFGIPLSSKLSDGRWFSRIVINGEDARVLLSQAGSFSASRLLNKIARAAEQDFNRVIKALKLLLLKE